jgi:uncharacterized protein involved in outer membrane biogenesis
MKKPVIIVLAVAVVVVVAAAIFLTNNLGALVAAAIEKAGSEATGSPVEVTGVKLSLREGRGEVAGLSVGNPVGFSGEDVFNLEDIVLDLDLGSLRGEPIVIDEIRVEGPRVRAEFQEGGKLNLDVLRRRLQENAPREDAEAGASPKKLRIARLHFADGEIAVDASALGLEPRTVKLPAFDLTDLGGEGGATPDALAREVLGAVAKQAARDVAGSEAQRLIEEKLGGSIGDKAKDLIKGLGN